MAKRVGRNDPCPCGSGKKYKHCCLATERHERVPRPARVRSTWSERRNDGDPTLTERSRQLAASCDPYHGLTPDQLRRLVAEPLTSPELISFPEPLDVEPAGLVMTLFKFLVEELGEEGVRATASGNLPRKLCRDAARMLWGDFLYEQRTQFKGINQETDLEDLHFVHVLARISGLVRRHRSRLILSRGCRQRLGEAGLAGIYSPLFLASASEYDWSCGEDNPFPLIQQASFFTLYLLARYGDRTLSNVFYEDCFLRLFPLEQHGEIRAYYLSPEDTLRSSYTRWSLEEFAEPFGLVRLKPYVKGDSMRGHFEIRKGPLLDYAVRFHVDL